MMALSFLGLVVFCYFSVIPLIIPLLVFFLGVHLFFFKKANPRLFLHLALLLALLVFAAHTLKSYPVSTHAYLPIAAITMLTMLLFNDVQVSFMMAFLSATLAGIIFGFGLNEMLIFFLGGLGRRLQGAGCAYPRRIDRSRDFCVHHPGDLRLAY